MISSTTLQWLASTSAPTPWRVKKWAAQVYVDRLLAPPTYRQAPPMAHPEFLAIHIDAATRRAGR